MKTAIPIRDDVFESAERMASAMGISRSDLYTRAGEDPLPEVRHVAEAWETQRDGPGSGEKERMAAADLGRAERIYQSLTAPGGESG